MFIEAAKFDLHMFILLGLVTAVPLALRILAGRFSSARWPVGHSRDPAPLPVKFIKGTLTLAVVAMPALTLGPIFTASERYAVIIEQAPVEDTLTFTKSNYLPDTAAFGAVRVLLPLGLAGTEPPGRNGAAELPEATRAALVEAVSGSNGNMFVNLTGRALVHWRISYTREGITPAPPVSSDIAPGEVLKRKAAPMHGGCADPPPHLLWVQGDRDIWLVRRKATIEGERFSTVSWFSWPELGSCVNDVLGLPQ